MRRGHSTILLVQDHLEEANFFREMFEKTPNRLYHLHHVHRLSEGIKFLRSSQAHVALLDLTPPNSHGLDSFLSLKTSFPDLPIVVLTGMEDVALGAKAMEKGAEDYLIKEEINSQTLLQSIRHAIEKQDLLSQLKQAQENVASFEARLTEILSALSDGVVIVDGKGIVRFANQAAASLLDTPQEVLLENPFEFPVTKEKRTEIQILRGEQIRFSEMQAVALKWKGKAAFLMFLRDITEHKQSQDRLLYLTNHDELTGLANGTLLRAHLKQSIARASEQKHLVAVLLLDIDHLKQVNNALGHTIGDELLQETAKRLTACMRRIDDLAHLGGGEFVIHLSHLTRVEDIPILAQKVIDTLCQPYYLQGYEWAITLSIGISIYPNDARDPETLLEYADLAKSRAKTSGRNSYQYYSPTLQARAKERLAVKNYLQSALHQKSFILYYQPIVSLETGRIVGMEALLRLKHPETGTHLPARFIPIAEETGMIVPIGTWALRAACAQNKTWQEWGLPPIVIAVNLSASQIKEAHFLSVVTHILSHTGLSPQYLELELTESMTQESEHTLSILSALREMGVKASIDDFGTGYSSLSYLKLFPFNTLKIDISFIRNMANREEDRKLVETIITIAHNLGLRAIAEGVETQEQVDILKSLGCDEAQGYFFSKPLSTDDATKLLHGKHSFF